MLRRICVSAVAAFVALGATGCVSVVKTNSLRAVEVTPRLEAVVAVDLDISDQKVTGTASSNEGDAAGALSSLTSKKKKGGPNKDELRQKAITQALEQYQGDVLLGAIFYYEESKLETKVTVVGYPARYKSFRSKGFEARRPAPAPAAPAAPEKAIDPSGE